jgi:Transcriptional regulators of sugar metabolism
MNHLRQELIRDYIEKNEVVTMKQLQMLVPDISLMTLHRDLDALQDLGYILKMRGGARSVKHTDDLEFSERVQENIEAKKIIASKAKKLIREHDSIFIDAGTTGLVLAKSLPDIDLTVFTSAPNIALELGRLMRPSINLFCGNLNRTNWAVSGMNTLEMLEKINIDLAFIGVSGCSVENGFTCGRESEMLVKNLIIRKARTSAALCDSTKFTRLMPFTFAALSDVDYIITEKKLPDRFMTHIEQIGIKIL